MDQNQIKCTLPNGAACGSVDMSRDEAVLILLQHCRDMKRQETRLRLVSLLLLLSCVALFIFTQFQRNSGASGTLSAATPSLAYSKQNRECPTAEPPTESPKLRTDLISVFDPNSVSSMKWKARLGGNYDDNAHAIEIPEDGIYFFYLRFTLRCYDQKKDFGQMSVSLLKWNPAYPIYKVLANASDSVQCREGVYRSSSVMQLFDLMKGDQVSVSLTNGSELIIDSSFGAFLT